jgi:hypothetical protein
MLMSKVFLSRRNLLVLLSKLDRVKAGEFSHCTIIKTDNSHPRYPQTMKEIEVTAVEDEDYYAERTAGEMHPSDEPPNKEATNGFNQPIQINHVWQL